MEKFIKTVYENLEQETKDRIEVDNQQWDRINYNTEHLISGGTIDFLDGILTLNLNNDKEYNKELELTISLIAFISLVLNCFLSSINDKKEIHFSFLIN